MSTYTVVRCDRCGFESSAHKRIVQQVIESEFDCEEMHLCPDCLTRAVAMLAGGTDVRQGRVEELKKWIRSESALIKIEKKREKGG